MVGSSHALQYPTGPTDPDDPTDATDPRDPSEPDDPHDPADPDEGVDRTGDHDHDEPIRQGDRHLVTPTAVVSSDDDEVNVVDRNLAATGFASPLLLVWALAVRVRRRSIAPGLVHNAAS